MAEAVLRSKSSLREDYKIKRDNLRPSQDLFQQIYENISEVLLAECLSAESSVKSSAYVASYKSFRSEVSLEGLAVQLQGQQDLHFKFCYPRIISENKLEFFSCEDSSDFESNSLNILEPKFIEENKILLESCSAILVPGLVFHRSGHRLGYGKGFYDKCLASYEGLKIGVALSDQVSSSLWMVQPTDIPMDYLVTENYILKTCTEECES